ncbi:Hpt domain-containing protein [Rubripirellula obstinata]|nr:Hpt domain-containing protein [Rubripirellula obstinata]
MNDIQKKRFSDALQRVSGDEDMLGMLATIAVEDAPAMMESLESQIDDPTLTEAARTAHSLKGLLSAFETGEPISELEPLIEAARRGDKTEAATVHAAIKPKLQSLMTEIEAIAD